MATSEAAAQVSEHVTAQMVDCAPDPPPAVALPDPPETSPTCESATATIEQTGADPPPEG